MANAGEGQDTLLLKWMIQTGTLLPIYPDENWLDYKIKTILNKVVEYDVIGTSYWNGYSSITHTAWRTMNKALLKVNQIRVNNLHYEPLKHGYNTTRESSKKRK